MVWAGANPREATLVTDNAVLEARDLTRRFGGLIAVDARGEIAIGEPVRAGGTIAAVAKPEFARFAFPTDTAVAG